MARGYKVVPRAMARGYKVVPRAMARGYKVVHIALYFQLFAHMFTTYTISTFFLSHTTI